MKTYHILRILLQAMIGLFAISLVHYAHAVKVPPGGIVFLGGTTSAANPDLAGVVLKDDLIPFQIKDKLGNIVLEGNVQDRVVRSDNTGKLIFAPRLRDLKTGIRGLWIPHLRLEGYSGFSTNINYRVDGLGDVGPNEVSRSAGTGSELLFRYEPDRIVPPDEALFLSVLTDAPAFCQNGKITIYAQSLLNPIVYSTTLENTVSPAVSPENCDVPDSPCTATVDLGLDIYVPSANYQTLGGTANIWFKLNFKGVDHNDDFIWRLHEFGVNQ